MPQQEPTEGQQESITGEQFLQELARTAEPLRAISNVIELKPDKKYMFVFKGMLSYVERDMIRAKMHEMGIRNIVISMPVEMDLEIIEIPEKQP